MNSAGWRKPSAGSFGRVLVDRSREERDHHRPEEHVGALGAVPRHPVAHLGAGALVERDRRIEVAHLHRQVRHTGHCHCRDGNAPADAKKSSHQKVVTVADGTPAVLSLE